MQKRCPSLHWDTVFGKEVMETSGSLLRSSSRSGGSDLGSRATGLRGTVALGELVDSAGGVDESLFTGEERMARGTDTHAERLLSGACWIDRTAGAGDGRLVSVGMDVGFHGFGKHVIPGGCSKARERGAATVGDNGCWSMIIWNRAEQGESSWRITQPGLGRRLPP